MRDSSRTGTPAPLVALWAALACSCGAPTTPLPAQAAPAAVTQAQRDPMEPGAAPPSSETDCPDFGPYLLPPIMDGSRPYSECPYPAGNVDQSSTGESLLLRSEQDTFVVERQRAVVRLASGRHGESMFVPGTDLVILQRSDPEPHEPNTWQLDLIDVGGATTRQVASVGAARFTVGHRRAYFVRARPAPGAGSGAGDVRWYLGVLDAFAPFAVREIDVPRDPVRFDQITRLKQTPDGRFVIGIWASGAVATWSTRTWKLVDVVEFSRDTANPIFSPDARFIIYGRPPQADGGIHVVDLGSDPPGHREIDPSPCAWLGGSSFSSDSTIIAVGSEESVCLFDRASGRLLGVPVARRPEPDWEARSRAWLSYLFPDLAADGRLLFVSGAHGDRAVYGTETGELLWAGEGWTDWRATVHERGRTHVVYGDVVYTLAPSREVSIQSFDEARATLEPLRPDLYVHEDAREPLARALCVKPRDRSYAIRVCEGVPVHLALP